TEPAVPVVAREIRLTDGSIRFCVDQLSNPDSVTFISGGIWSDDIVLHGRVATASDTEASQQLMKRFAAVFRKKFSKIKAFWVGPRAMALLDAGRRLTISVQSPREFDLVR